MSFVAPQTLTSDEQKLILRATAKHPRDHLIISMAVLVKRFFGVISSAPSRCSE